MKAEQTILVAEDDPNDQFFTLEAFHTLGVQNPIRMVNSGNEAIAYLKGEGRFGDREKFPYPAFIITDLKMPDGDGFLLLDYLKKHPEHAVVSAAVLSASDDPNDVSSAYALGATSYHKKPPGFDQLKDLLLTLHNYWQSCCVPEVDVTGRRITHPGQGKMGERLQPHP